MPKFLNIKCFAVLILCFMCEVVNCDTENNDYVQFIDGDFASFPKCCPLQTFLIVTDDGFNCTAGEITLTHLEIFASNIATNTTIFSDNCEGVDCVDYLKNDTEVYLTRMQNCYAKTIYKQYFDFPKCCPFDQVYDPENYNCVPHNHTVYAFNESLQVINVSLSHCPPINFAIVNLYDEFQVNEDKSVTLTSGKSFKHGRYCIDKNIRSGKDMIRACMDYEDACEKMKKRCVKKCCPDGEAYITFGPGPPKCRPHYSSSFNLSNYFRFHQSDENIEYGILRTGPVKRYLATTNHKFYVDMKGDFHIREEDSDWAHLSPRDAYYCVENYNEKITSFLFVGQIFNFQLVKFYVNGITLGLSCFFLALTIMCYMFLPEMQNVHGKSIMMFCIFMFVGFLNLSFAQLHKVPSINICTTIGFTIVFSFLGAFAWMNVICFDMWMAFGTMRVLNVQNKRKDQKKFLYYNLYAWGVPIIICGFAVTAHIFKFLPDEYSPHIGKVKCYFEKYEHTTYDYFIYFIIPVSTMILINVVYFIKTAVYCYKVKNEIHKMRGSIGDNKEAKQRKFKDDKEKLIMLVKLFLVMGISWTFEALFSIFSITDTSVLRDVEAVIDCFNASQGIIIFFIFIVKKKVWISIKTRLGMKPTRRVSEFSTGVFRVTQRLHNMMITKHRVVNISGKR
ncbi:uncharacterized protein [Atheta coriaria]|uniref:uncharacterized protein isoform X2 n=1 Tax=Dalotia coriaria TaxID=877792 RepID=UPI0031F3E597